MQVVNIQRVFDFYTWLTNLLSFLKILYTSTSRMSALLVLHICEFPPGSSTSQIHEAEKTKFKGLA